MYDNELKKNFPTVEQPVDPDEMAAEIECWLIDDFVDILSPDRRLCLAMDPA